MDIFLIAFGFLMLLLGLAGAVLPLPGPPLSLAGIFLIHWSSRAEFTSGQLWTYALLTLVVTAIDTFLPLWGQKKFGGSRFGMLGGAVGMLAGLAVGPFGLLLGAFLGGLAGELLAGQQADRAFTASLGSFAGFLFGSLLKVALCLAMIWASVAVFL
ncbi:MAG: DUF456 domain-containing protein [Saprospiraceae bacterium]|nr:DUF456 domain-containing protein [Saprospiraceae bacterium]